MWKSSRRVSVHTSAPKDYLRKCWPSVEWVKWPNREWSQKWEGTQCLHCIVPLARFTPRHQSSCSWLQEILPTVEEEGAEDCVSWTFASTWDWLGCVKNVEGAAWCWLLWNYSLPPGKVSDVWKKAKARLIFKKGKEENPESKWMVTLLTAPGKIKEQVV